jgi:GxxExxY protein
MDYANDPITLRVINCVIHVHQALGTGFLEGVYRRALSIEFSRQHVAAEAEKQIAIFYRGREVGRHRLDFLVEGELIVELKTVECIGKAHYAQVRSYLKAAGVSRGLLVNCAGDRADFRRIEMQKVAPVSAHEGSVGTPRCRDSSFEKRVGAAAGV